MRGRQEVLRQCSLAARFVRSDGCDGPVDGRGAHNATLSSPVLSIPARALGCAT